MFEMCGKKRELTDFRVCKEDGNGYGRICKSTECKQQKGYGCDMNLWIDKIRIILCFSFLLWEGLLDKRNQKIILPPVGIFFLLGIGLSVIQGREDFLQAFLGALIGTGVLLMAYLTKNKIGYGDGFVLTATGALLGFRMNMLMFLFGLFLASLKGIWIMISGKGTKNTGMPFVPFLVPGLTLTLALTMGGLG